jgi:hypothetical protein
MLRSASNRTQPFHEIFFQSAATACTRFTTEFSRRLLFLV